MASRSAVPDFDEFNLDEFNSLSLNRAPDLDLFDLNCVISKCKRVVAVLFYHPFSPDGAQIVDQYKWAASTLHQRKVPVILTKVNVENEENRHHAIHHKIDFVPQIKIFTNRGERVEDYKGPFLPKWIVKHKGPFNPLGLVECLTRLSAPVFPPQINSANDAEILVRLKKDNIVIVGVFPELSKDFMAATEILKWNYDVYVASDATNLPLERPSTSGPLVRMFVPFDKGYVDTEKFDVDDLLEFVRLNSIPIVFRWNIHPQPFIDKKYFGDTENDKVILYINPEDKDDCELETVYLKVAEKYRGQGLIFMLGNLEASETLEWYFDITTSEIPLIVIENNKREIYARQLQHNYFLETWVDDYKAGRVTRVWKSGPIPLKNDEPVKVVVRAEFDKMVMNANKNVLLELYRPEFKNCEEVDSVLREVALCLRKKGPKYDDVVIVKLDESANDIRSDNPDDLRTYGDSPVLYLIPTTGPIVTYSDEITVDDIIYFIKKCRYNPSKKQKVGEEMCCD